MAGQGVSLGVVAEAQTPELSADWHADELFVKMKGGINYKAHYGGEAKNIAFLWNVMDRKTRFLLASKVSTWRDVAGADRAYREALSNAGGQPPRDILHGRAQVVSNTRGFAPRVREATTYRKGGDSEAPRDKQPD